jgi:hypothetical protein
MSPCRGPNLPLRTVAQWRELVAAGDEPCVRPHRGHLPHAKILPAVIQRKLDVAKMLLKVHIVQSKVEMRKSACMRCPRGGNAAAAESRLRSVSSHVTAAGLRTRANRGLP